MYFWKRRDPVLKYAFLIDEKCTDLQFSTVQIQSYLESGSQVCVGGQLAAAAGGRGIFYFYPLNFWACVETFIVAKQSKAQKSHVTWNKYPYASLNKKLTSGSPYHGFIFEGYPWIVKKVYVMNIQSKYVFLDLAFKIICSSSRLLSDGHEVGYKKSLFM